MYSNGSYWIVACVFVAAGMCLPNRCLAMYRLFWLQYSGFQASCHKMNFSNKTLHYERQLVIWYRFRGRSLIERLQSEHTEHTNTWITDFPDMMLRDYKSQSVKNKILGLKLLTAAQVRLLNLVTCKAFHSYDSMCRRAHGPVGSRGRAGVFR
jgi:hypothetical protein